jgi:hypothetical protein
LVPSFGGDKITGPLDLSSESLLSILAPSVFHNSKKILSPLIISGSIIELILISDSPLLSNPVTILLCLLISFTTIF